MVFRHTVVATLAAVGLVLPLAAPADAAPHSTGCAVPVLGPVCAPQTAVLDGKQLLRTKFAALVGEKTSRTALNNLLTAAKTDLTEGPWSVTSKKQIPPSGGQARLPQPGAVLVADHAADRRKPVGLPVRAA